MGNTESMESQLAVIRSRAAPVRLPMPDPAELEERFSIALVNTQHTRYTHPDRDVLKMLHCENMYRLLNTRWITGLTVGRLAC